MGTDERETIVTFPSGSERENAIVTKITEYQDNVVVVTDQTPFHPIDPWWPDQPSDRGWLIIEGRSMRVTGAILVGINSPSGEIRLGDISSIKRSDASWKWCVGHIVRLEGVDLPVGTGCELVVDSPFRAAIAVGHSACHVAALALNAALNKFWRKEAARDSWGNVDFDQMAIQRSTIESYGSVDQYRIGRAVRKSGFKADEFWKEFDEIPREIIRLANDIAQSGSKITVEPDHVTFAARRTWSIQYRGAQLSIPCGGVHPRSLGEIRGINITFQKLAEDVEFSMHTRVINGSS